MSNPDYAEQYCREGVFVSVCSAFSEGQEFVTSFDKGKPEGFCAWAWDDIYKYIAVFISGGNMGDSFKWMKDNNSVIACCTDGVRPVVFKIELI
jgi:uncharacterized repeat protein (TIGR04076 family)